MKTLIIPLVATMISFCFVACGDTREEFHNKGDEASEKAGPTRDVSGVVYNQTPELNIFNNKFYNAWDNATMRYQSALQVCSLKKNRDECNTKGYSLFEADIAQIAYSYGGGVRDCSGDLTVGIICPNNCPRTKIPIPCKNCLFGRDAVSCFVYICDCS